MNLEKDADMQLLREATLKLGEHFEVIQVVAVRRDDKTDQESFIFHGRGNYYARYGLVKHWLMEMDAKAAAEALADEDDDQEADL